VCLLDAVIAFAARLVCINSSALQRCSRNTMTCVVVGMSSCVAACSTHTLCVSESRTDNKKCFIINVCIDVFNVKASMALL
jgi:hypothetical protein